MTHSLGINLSKSLAWTLAATLAFAFLLTPSQTHAQTLVASFPSNVNGFDLDVDADGSVWTWGSSGGLGRLRKFDQTGTLLHVCGSTGTSSGSALGGIDASSNGEVYAADPSLHEVVVFDSNCTVLRSWGGLGSLNGQFNSPSGVSVDEVNGEVYVADAFNHRVQVFDLNGTFLRSWGTNGTGNGQFQQPQDVEYDASSGLVYVSESVGNRIQAFQPDGSFVASVSGVNTTSSQFLRGNMESAGDGTFWISDQLDDEILQFDSSLNLVSSFSDSDDPTGVALNAAGDIFTIRILFPGDVRIYRLQTPVSECAQTALDALGLEADDLPVEILEELEASCTTDQAGVVEPGTTENGSTKLEAGDTLVVGSDAELNGTTQTTVDGNGSGLLILGEGATINGSIKNIGTVVISGSNVSVSGSMTGIGTLYYLSGSSLTVGGNLEATTIIDLR